MRWTICLVGFVLLVLLPASSRGAVDAEAVNRAIDRGVAMLKQNQQSDGSWHYGKDQWFRGKTGGIFDFGLTALAGLTLLHCGVPATDPAVIKAANYIRSRIGKVNLAASKTYSFTLTILFLDRLGEAGDKKLIRKLTGWLIANQVPFGVRRSIPPGPLLGRVIEQPVPDFGWTYAEKTTAINLIRSDNSNTQFALLGLWTGQRHGVRVSRSLAAAARRFYASQGGDGGWPYNPVWMQGYKQSTLSMSYAGLLALAYHHAAANKEILFNRSGRRALAKTFHDRAIVAGFEYLKKRRTTALADDTSWITYGVTAPYYSLWMLERVAAAYDLDRIDGLDWYNEAVQWLLPRQQTDGGWGGEITELCDAFCHTCFALLVLRRANLSPDMTSYLKGQLPPLKPIWSMPLKTKAEQQPDLAGQDIREALRQTAVSVHKKPDDTAIQALLKQLAQADGSQRNRLLHTWRDGEDERYTPALAKAIVTLSGPAERKARAALADRLTRLTVHEREEYLRSVDPEIRRAAVLSCAVRDDHQHIARLIKLLEDKEAPVAHAAHAVLCSLTGQDFGPGADASQADRDRAVADWKTWYNKQAKK